MERLPGKPHLHKLLQRLHAQAREAGHAGEARHATRKAARATASAAGAHLVCEWRSDKSLLAGCGRLSNSNFSWIKRRKANAQSKHVAP